jgi:hypothetical protein
MIVVADTSPLNYLVLIGRSTNMSLLGMLSLKLRRSVARDGEKEAIIGDPEASKLLRRAYRAPRQYPEV